MLVAKESKVKPSGSKLTPNKCTQKAFYIRDNHPKGDFYLCGKPGHCKRDVQDLDGIKEKHPSRNFQQKKRGLRLANEGDATEDPKSYLFPMDIAHLGNVNISEERILDSGANRQMTRKISSLNRIRGTDGTMEIENGSVVNIVKDKTMVSIAVVCGMESTNYFGEVFYFPKQAPKRLSFNCIQQIELAVN